SVPEAPGAREEAANRLGRVLELLHVREVAAGFHGVHESARRAAPPRGKSRRLRQPIKRVVDLDRVDALRVVVQPAALRQLGWIKVAAPVPVLPAGATDTYVSI